MKIFLLDLYRLVGLFFIVKFFFYDIRAILRSKNHIEKVLALSVGLSAEIAIIFTIFKVLTPGEIWQAIRNENSHYDYTGHTNFSAIATFYDFSQLFTICIGALVHKEVKGISDKLMMSIFYQSLLQIALLF